MAFPRVTGALMRHEYCYFGRKLLEDCLSEISYPIDDCTEGLHMPLPLTEDQSYAHPTDGETGRHQLAMT